MITKQNAGAHSALVRMHLIVNGTCIPITHMASDYLLVNSATDHPTGTATIVLQVDDSERQWKVRLPQGISKDSKRVTLALAQ